MISHNSIIADKGDALFIGMLLPGQLGLTLTIAAADSRSVDDAYPTWSL
jgi:hypothetical protein